MNDMYNLSIINKEITGCKFALISKFLKIQHSNKEELINIKNCLSKISEMENAIRNNLIVDIISLQNIKEYVTTITPEYRTKTK